MASSDFVPEPTIVLLGCQPWPPRPDPRRPDACPVCGGTIQPAHQGTHCGWCDQSTEAINRRCRAALTGLRARERHEEQARQAEEQLRNRKGQTRLTESERRRLWNGYKGGILSPSLTITNRAQIGRAFLTRIGQEPDWNLILDGRGQVIGRYEAAPEPETP